RWSRRRPFGARFVPRKPDDDTTEAYGRTAVLSEISDNADRRVALGFGEPAQTSIRVRKGAFPAAVSRIRHESEDDLAGLGTIVVSPVSRNQPRSRSIPDSGTPGPVTSAAESTAQYRRASSGRIEA